MFIHKVILLALGMMFIQCKSQKALEKDIDISNAKPVLRYEKTPCYGQCPSFVFHLYDNGLASYEGRKFVENEGYYQAILADDSIAMLSELLKKYHFTSFDPEYIQRNISDLPQTIITHDDHQVKYHDMRAPDSLKELSQKIREMIDKVDWKKVDNPRS